MLWRLLLDGAEAGAHNMAVDEALLLSQSPGDAPILRFYDWNPPTISIGRFQDSRLKTQNSKLPFVRRPTGGRAIWHQHEITYAVVLREELLPPQARSVVGAYEWLSRGFVAGLNALGVTAALANGESKAARTENCFASAARSDFVVEGRKLIGAAQCRKHGAILQHGSLLLSVDEAAWRDALGGSLQSMVSLSQLGIVASRHEIIAALCRGIRETLRAQLQSSALTVEEANLAARLEHEKYRREDWNLRAKEC